MISRSQLKVAGYIGVVLFIFFAGFKANGYLWSAKYDKLEASHETAIAEQRQRLLSRQERINDETDEREMTLLRELEIQREQYDQLEASINTTPIIVERIVQCSEDADADSFAVAVVDWSEFGRLYDSAAIARPAADAGTAESGDESAADGVAETR